MRKLKRKTLYKLKKRMESFKPVGKNFQKRQNFQSNLKNGLNFQNRINLNNGQKFQKQFKA